MTSTVEPEASIPATVRTGARRQRWVPGAATFESIALGVGALSFVITAVIAMIVFRFESAPINGPGSVGQFVAIVGAIVAPIAYVGGWYAERHRERATEIAGTVRRSAGARVLDGLDVAAIAFAHSMITLLGWLVLSDVFERAFLDASVFALPVIILSATAAAVTGYFVFLSAVSMTPMLLSTVLLIFLVFGGLASMLTATDPHWWKENLSALGMTDDLSAMAFNLTLVVAGVIVTAIARYATAHLRTDNPRGIRIVRTALIVIGVCLACVGIFPVDEFMTIHNVVASGMCFIFVAVVIGVRSWIPQMPKAFIALGLAYVAVIVVLAVFFATGYYTLTAVELVVAVLIFSWVILFIRNTSAIERDAAAA